MQIEENCLCGKSVFLEPGESLELVPASHRMLLTSALRSAFADPVAHFTAVAERCPSPAMARWIRAVIAAEQWRLALHRSVYPHIHGGGFEWKSAQVLSAEMAPAEDVPSELPAALREYYALVDHVHWGGFGSAGGLRGADDCRPITEYWSEFSSGEIDPAQTFEFGSSRCGDMLVFTPDGRGGWFGHDEGSTHLLGTIDEMIEWVFTQLLANEYPEFDYDQHWK